MWWDTTLRAGEAYDEVTEQALREAKAVVVLWSPRSVVSRWVRAEATLADRNQTLVPCTIEPCERPIMFELIQTTELSHWRGDAGDRAWAAFLADVQRFVAREAEPVSAAPARTLDPPSVQETLKPGQSGSAPSLAVLPFTNRSSLPEDEVFAEGMVEDVISALSQGVNVRVLGSTATANLSRVTITDLAAVGRQLGVRYLLEGNVRRVVANLRVTTQLLEAATGEIAWTGKFDRPLTELASLQEELVTEIAASLDAQVHGIDIERALKKPGDLTAWEAITRFEAALRKFDPSAIQRANDEAKRAVAIAPDYGPAHAALALALAHNFLASSDSPADVQRVRESAERAVTLAPDDAMVLGFVGYALALVGYPEEGVRHTARGARKAPGSGLMHFQNGASLVLSNRPEDGLLALERAARLMPGSHLMVWVKRWQARALHVLGRWEAADEANDESINLYPSFGFFFAMKARFCVALGRETEALTHIATAGRLGWDLALTEPHWRSFFPNSPGLEDDIAIIRALYAATEPGA